MVDFIDGLLISTDSYVEMYQDSARCQQKLMCDFSFRKRVMKSLRLERGAREKRGANGCSLWLLILVGVVEGESLGLRSVFITAL